MPQEEPTTRFALEQDLKQRRFEYKLNDEEKALIAKKKRYVNFSIDKDGIFCTYSFKNAFVEQKERYFTLLEALNNIPS